MTDTNKSISMTSNNLTKSINNELAFNEYDGEYENDVKWGYGVYKWKSGNIYKGKYEDDERHGYGEMHWTDGSVYKGMWHKGIQHGKGRMEFPDGTVKEGLFENNIFQGKTHDRLKLFQNKNYNITNYSSLEKAAYTTTATLDSEFKQNKTLFNKEEGHKSNSKMMVGIFIVINICR